MLAAKRYFSGDDDAGWERGAPPRPASGSTATSPLEGVSSSTIVSGLVASRKQDQAVGFLQGSSMVLQCSRLKPDSLEVHWEERVTDSGR